MLDRTLATVSAAGHRRKECNFARTLNRPIMLGMHPINCRTGHCRPSNA